MQIHWSQRSLEDRREIQTYIARDSPSAAIEVDTRIEQQVDRLQVFPEQGRTGRVVGTRELVIRRTPYVAVYVADHQNVRVLRILHGAQRWPLP